MIKGDNGRALGYNGGMGKENEERASSKDKPIEPQPKDGRRKDTAKKPTKKSKEVKFSWFYYIVLMVCCAVLKVLLRCKTVKSRAFSAQKKKGAMLVLSNHVSAYDFIYFTTPFFGKKVNYVVAENMMYSRPAFAKLLEGYHTISKKQFYADLQCIKNIKRYLDAGISVILCPEGKVSAEGETARLSETVARLVQWLGYPVASVKINGGGLVRPKWAHGRRKGRVVVECDMLFDDGAVLKKEDKGVICQKINAALAHNEHKWQWEQKLNYKGEALAEGLEKLLYYCPACGASFQNESSGDVLLCKNCGNKVRYTERGQLLPVGESKSLTRIDIWFDKQKELVKAEVEKEGFFLEETVDLFCENEERNGYKYIARGRLRLEGGKLVFRADKSLFSGEEETLYTVNKKQYRASASAACDEEEYQGLSFRLCNGEGIANIPGDSVDMYDEKHVYRFVFTHHKASTKYVLAAQAARELAERGE